MTAVFSVVLNLPSEVRASGPEGRVVFSQLSYGDAPIYCATPSLKFVLEGEERYEVDGRLQVVRPGEFLVVDAGVSLRVILPRREVTTGLCIYLPAAQDLPFRPYGAAGVWPEDEIIGERAVVQSASATSFGRRLRKAAARLAVDGDAGASLAPAMAAAAADEFTGFADGVANQLSRLGAIKCSTRGDLLRRLDRARAYLHDHGSRIVRLDELALVAGMSQFHLTRTFRAVYGLPPGAYHRSLRVSRAATELSRGSVTISEAAQRFGFSDPSTFTRAFKREHGLTPGRHAQGR